MPQIEHISRQGWYAWTEQVNELKFSASHQNRSRRRARLAPEISLYRFSCGNGTDGRHPRDSARTLPRFRSAAQIGSESF